MVPTSLAKDIEVEIIFSISLESGERLVQSDNHSIGLFFGEEDLWRVKLWQEHNEPDFAIGIPTRFFVEFEFPQSLSGNLMPGNNFEVWLVEDYQSKVIGKGVVLELLKLEARAQENIENIILRPSGEAHQTKAFIESLCGESTYQVIDNPFYQKLKLFLGMENIPDYQWLWGKPNRLHTFVEFNHPKHIPSISLFLPENPVPIWFLVDIDLRFSTWFLYDATFTAVEKILAKYKFSKYYIVAKDLSWLVRKVDRQFIAIGSNVENKLKQFPSM